MKSYTTFAKNKYTGKSEFLSYEFSTKAEFIQNCRANGYMVNPKKVKESNLFWWIMEHTNCDSWDWEIKKIPEEN